MKKLVKKAIEITLPVMVGYLFLGFAFGLLLQNAGYNFIWAFFISLFVYAGSMQFVLVSLLSSGAGILSVIITTLSVNSRHIFYGLSFIEKFKEMGKKKWYMIFALTDETYSLLCGIRKTEGINENALYFAISLLDQSYWIMGSVLGAIVGNMVHFNTKGIEFSMTALFVVTFVEQWIRAKSKLPAILGLLCGIISLAVFGSSNFLIPAMVSAVILLIGLKGKVNTLSTKEGSGPASDQC